MQYSYNPFQKTQVSDLKVYDGGIVWKLLELKFWSFFQVVKQSKGDVPCTPFNIQKALEQIYQYTAELRYVNLDFLRLKFISKISKNVICVGGDHTISYALLRAASEQAAKPVSLLHFDTHLDTGRS